MNTMRTWLKSLIVFSLVLAAHADQIIIKGSNTVGEELGPALMAAFQVHHPDVAIELTTEGTGGGMLALLNGQCDLASASRTASDDELRLARARGVRLQSHFIGSYGVSVIVNERNAVQSLTLEQIRDIFTGKITNWREVDGRNAPINLYIRDPVSGTYLGFKELAMEYQPYAANVQTRLTYPEIMNAVARDRDGIGYTGMTLVGEDAVRAVLVNGIPGNMFSVNEGLYPYARGLRFYTTRGNESAAARAFFRFVRGRVGQAILESQGYVPRAMQRMDTGGIAP